MCLQKYLDYIKLPQDFFKGESGLVEIKNNKLNIMMDLFKKDIDGKVIIWANWIQNITQIENELKRVYGNESVVSFYGAKTTDERQDAIQRFQKDDKCRFFVANPSTGGYGITFNSKSVYCNLIFLIPYNAEHRVQSEERAYRIGQTKKSYLH